MKHPWYNTWTSGIKIENVLANTLVTIDFHEKSYSVLILIP